MNLSQRSLSAWQAPPPLNWGTVPLLLPTLAFSCGIWISARLHFWTSTLLPWLLLVLAFSLAWLARKRYAKQAQRRRLSALGLLLFLAIGFWRAGSQHLPNQANYFDHYLLEDQAAMLSLRVNSIRNGKQHFRLVTTVEYLLQTAGDSVAQRPVCGNLLLYLPPNGKGAEVSVGDQLIVHGRPSEIPGPLNPKAFDFANYWAKKQLYHRLFIRNNSQWRFTKSGNLSILDQAAGLREHWINSFRSHLSSDGLAVAAALVLGKRDLLNADLKSAYADTGAVHVLAVSGLHVGIVAWIISWLLGRILPQRKWGRLISLVLTLVGIWGFALLTGLSPSVQRAAIMFSVLSFGRWRKQRSYLFNSLAIAAIGILIWNPLQLFQIGFQLSFAAVAGIGLYYRVFEKMLYSRWAIIRFLWSVLSVSLAAQLGTLPLSIYYFHQLPTYFLITGSIVIFTAQAALITGLLHGLLAWVSPWLSLFTGKVLNIVIELQNAVVFHAQKLPNALQKTAWISSYEVCLLYATIAAFSVWLRWRKWHWLLLALLGVLTYGSLRLAQVQKTSQQQKTIVYHQPKAVLIDCIAGNEALAIHPSEFEADLTFTAQNHRDAFAYGIAANWYWPATAPSTIPAQFGTLDYPLFDDPLGSRWLLVKATDQLPDSIPSSIDFILPQTGCCMTAIAQSCQAKTAAFSPPKIIIDGSAPFYRVKQWQSLRDSLNLSIHITGIDGAFTNGH